MRRFVSILLLLVTFSAMAEEKGLKRLERISNHYAAMGSYSVSFVMCAGNETQRGEMLVEGKNSYLKIADMELFIEDALRYEVRGAAKEIIVDKADAYEKELLNSLNALTVIAADFTITECEIEGRAAVKLVPKKSGETIYVITGADGASIAKLRYGAGENLVEVRVERSGKSTQKLPRFSKERYKGFELIDFR